MNEAQIRTDSSAYNAQTLGRQLIHEEHNSAYNHHAIVNRFKSGRARDINDEPKVSGSPCFILGSGASLDRVLPKLKDWQGGIICTTSHALSLMYYGIEPTHILALDPFNCYHEIEGVDWSKTKTKLITTPGVWPTLIEKWPNEMLLYRQSLGGNNSYYATAQKRMYTVRTPLKEEDKNNPDGVFRDATFNFIIRTEVTQFACSPPCQMFCAQILGYGRIFLAGCDFGFVDNKDRFTNYTVLEPEKSIQVGNSESVVISEKKWQAHNHPIQTSSTSIISENGIETSEIHLFYKKNLITAWRLSLQDVYTVDKGIITEIPYVDIDYVIKHKGEKLKRTSHDFIIDRSERYLARVGAFVIQSSNGFSFVESLHPIDEWIGSDGKKREPELITFMKQIQRRWHCDKHDDHIGNAEDDKDYTGHQCQYCKDGRMRRAALIDIDANMKRFKKYLPNGSDTNVVVTSKEPV